MMLPIRSILSAATPSAQQVVVGVGRRRPQHVGNRIGDEAIDFLRHAAVTAAQSGLEVYDRYPEFGADHRAGGRRIDVANDNDPVGAVLEADLFIGNHDVAGLLGMRAAADAEMKVRIRHAEVFEYRVRHVVIVVLTGMHKHRLCPVGSRQCVIERRDFHEIRPGGRYQMNLYT